MELFTEEQLYFHQDIVPPDFAYVTFLRCSAAPLSKEQRDEIEKEVVAQFLASQVEAGLLDKCELDDTPREDSEMGKKYQVISKSPPSPVKIWKYEDDKGARKPTFLENRVVSEMPKVEVTVKKKKRAYKVETRKSGGRRTSSTRKCKQRIMKNSPQDSFKDESVSQIRKKSEPRRFETFSPNISDV